MLKIKHDGFSRVAYVVSDGPISVQTSFNYEKQVQDGLSPQAVVLDASRANAAFDDGTGRTLYLYQISVLPTFEEIRKVFPDAKQVIFWAIITHQTTGEVEFITGTVSVIHTYGGGEGLKFEGVRVP